MTVALSLCTDMEEERDLRTSGIFLRTTERSPLEIAEAARDIVRSGATAVLLTSTFRRGPVAAVASPDAPADTLGYPLELRLASWLTTIEQPTALSVPEYLKSWLPSERVVAIPMSTPCWTAGFLVVPREGLTHDEVVALRDLAAEIAAELETSDRRDRTETPRVVGTPVLQVQAG